MIPGEQVPSRVLDALDRYQRTRRWVGFPLAVIYKFTDDQGPYLAALIAYYGRCFPCCCCW